MDAARSAASARVSKFIPVEKGVTGKEKLFQQNRNFGPGPIKPYPNAQPQGELQSKAKIYNGVSGATSRQRVPNVARAPSQHEKPRPV